MNTLKSNQDLENESVKFRDFCKEVGLINKFSKMFAKLFDDNVPPENCLSYSRQYISPNCVPDEEYAILNGKYEKSLKRIKLLEQSIDILKKCPNIEKPDKINALESLWENFHKNYDCNSNALHRYLTPQIYEELKCLETSTGYTFYDCIVGGLKFPNSEIGIYACDVECYKIFAKIFIPIIRYHHGLIGLPQNESIYIKASDYGNIYHLTDLDPTGDYITSIQIRCFRNLKDYPFVCALNDVQLMEIENIFKNFIKILNVYTSGSYHSLKYMNNSCLIDDLRKRKLLFDIPTNEESSIGFYNNWPIGRGLYISESEEMFIWVNYQEHLKLTWRKKGAHLRDIYEDFIDTINLISNNFEFCRNSQYGKLTANPLNLGHSLRVSVLIRLPNLSQNPLKLEKIIEKFKLKIENSYDDIGKCYRISNKYKLKLTEYDVVKDFQDKILVLIELDKKHPRHYLLRRQSGMETKHCKWKYSDESYE